MILWTELLCLSMILCQTIKYPAGNKWMENKFLQCNDTPSPYFIYTFVRIIIRNLSSYSQSVLLAFWTNLSRGSEGGKEGKEEDRERRPRVMMMVGRRFGCCTRDRKTSVDFDEQDSKISILSLFAHHSKKLRFLSCFWFVLCEFLNETVSFVVEKKVVS